MRRGLRLAVVATEAYETSEQDRIDMADAIFILMLAHARGEALDTKLVAKLETYGVDADQLDTIAETVSREAAGKMFGLKWTDGIGYVDDPAGKSITDTTDAAVNRAIETTPPEELLTVIAGLTVFGAVRADFIAEDQLFDLTSAMRLGSMEAAGVTQVDVLDARGLQGGDTDEACIAADGARWPMRYAMQNIKEHPNCTREFVPVWP